MKFSGEILIIMKEGLAETRWLGEVGEPLTIPICKTSDPADRVQRAIGGWIQDVGKRYVDYWSNTEDYVNCPEGDLLLPIDRWHCKITGKLCPIGARVPLRSRDNFMKGCNIEIASGAYSKSPTEYKAGIWQAVQNEKYSGGHHKVGRRPCVFCREKERNYYLHFPWEMSELYAHFDDCEDARSSRELLIDGIAYKIGQNICTQCFLELDEDHPKIDFSDYGLDFSCYQSVEYSFSY